MSRVTGSECAHMTNQVRQAWPDDALNADEEREMPKLFAHFEQATVAVVISDLLAADQPRPSLADWSRLLRSYANEVPKDPMPAPNLPRRPSVCDFDDLPPVDPNFKERVDELRKLLTK